MPRLFIAVDLPERARELLAGIAFGLPGAHWLPPEQYHLTLRFLGEVDESMFRAIREGLGGLVSPSFHLTLRGVGHFPPRGEPEVLWAGVTKNEELSRLRAKVESLVAGKGMERDTRKFLPHVTLARVKESRSAWVGEYLAAHSLFSAADLPIQGFSLYSSRLTPDGAVHMLEGAYPLQGILEPE